MKSIIQDMKHNYFVNAVIMVLLGLVLVIWPHILGVLLCYLLGGALIVMGVFQLISFLRGERLGFYNKFCHDDGNCAGTAGNLDMYPAAYRTLNYSGSGGNYRADSWSDGHPVYTGYQEGWKYEWWIALIAAILTLVVGLLLVFNPFTAYEITMVLLGIAMLYDGGSDLALFTLFLSGTARYRSETA